MSRHTTEGGYSPSIGPDNPKQQLLSLFWPEERFGDDKDRVGTAQRLIRDIEKEGGDPESILSAMWGLYELALSEPPGPVGVKDQLLGLLQEIPVYSFGFVVDGMRDQRLHGRWPVIGREPDLNVLNRVSGVSPWRPEHEDPYDTQLIVDLGERYALSALESGKLRLSDEFRYSAGAAAVAGAIVL